MQQNIDEDVFTVPELANYLRMKPITIYKHVAGGKLPGFKVGSQWRFKKKTIDLWISDQEKNNFTYKSVKVN
ncbi:MAG: excisionase family DNA binding protein [Candidatus Omnitrophota bacterium]|jgi:excisionase family DNA binding protein